MHPAVLHPPVLGPDGDKLLVATGDDAAARSPPPTRSDRRAGAAPPDGGACAVARLDAVSVVEALAVVEHGRTSRSGARCREATSYPFGVGAVLTVG